MGVDRQRKNDLFSQAARVGKALANGSRLELLELLAQGEMVLEDLYHHGANPTPHRDRCRQHLVDHLGAQCQQAPRYLEHGLGDPFSVGHDAGRDRIAESTC